MACGVCREIAGDFGLGVEGGQGNRPVCGGEGVRNIATQSRHIADLRARDQVTGFDQCLGVRANQRVQSDAVDRDGSADVEFIPPQFERVHLRDESQIH